MINYIYINEGTKLHNPTPQHYKEFNVPLNGVNIGAMASRGHENNLRCGLGLGWAGMRMRRILRRRLAGGGVRNIAIRHAHD